MPMPGRNGSVSHYRMGFNGMEKDDEIAGKGNHIDFKFRGYDPRIGRFWSSDPLHRSYPWNSTYAFAENDVIRAIDLEGLEKYIVIVNKSWGENKQQIIDYKKVELKTAGPLGNGVAVKLNIFGTEKYFYGNSAADDKDFIKFYEGNGIPGHPFERYNDSRCYATIGYGHLMSEADKKTWPTTASNKPFVVGSKISEADADRLFESDYISHRKMALDALIIDELNCFQRDAVIDFGYNIKNAKKRIGEFTKEKGGKIFLEYMSGGTGLEKRRIAESILWEEGEYFKLDEVKGTNINIINTQIDENDK